MGGNRSRAWWFWRRTYGAAINQNLPHVPDGFMPMAPKIVLKSVHLLDAFLLIVVDLRGML